MMKPILAIAAALSLAIAGVGIADKSLDGGKCPGECGLECPGDCGVDCPGDCGPKTCKGRSDACGHGEAKATGTDKTEAKANTGGARVTKTKFVSLKGEGHEPGHKCGHKGRHNGRHPEGHEGCRDRCGHGAGKVEAKADVTDAARANLTKFVSLKTENDGEGTCPGDCGADCPGDCGVDCPGDCTPGDCEGCSERMCQPEGQCPANLLHGGCGGCKRGCGNGHAKSNATNKTEAATSTAVAHVANTQ